MEGKDNVKLATLFLTIRMEAMLGWVNLRILVLTEGCSSQLLLLELQPRITKESLSIIAMMA